MAEQPDASGFWHRLWWSLAGRIWLTNLVLVLVMAALALVSILRLAVLERSVNSVLSRNYKSIEAADGMLGAVSALRTRDQTAASAAAQFRKWLDVEQHNLTEPGEGELASRIGKEGDELFASAAIGSADVQPLEHSLRELIALNEHAMFSADRHTVAVARSFRTAALLLVIAAMLLLAGSSYALARTLALGPLRELKRTLKSIDDEQSLRAMAPPKTSELAELAREFNAMVARLQDGVKVRLEELNRERSKTAAIIESIEDGLIVLDRARKVVHINEVACAILELPPRGLMGLPLEQLSHKSLHLARLAAALERNRNREGVAVEFKVFIRGRDHTYVARELRWSDAAAGQTELGTIVLMQDVTLVRDQERRHNNLIATLSHELKTPLTSLTIGAELLGESMDANLSARQREILATLREDAGRLQTIANDLLDASRISAARISVERRPIMFDRVVEEVCRTFRLQAEEKGIRFELKIGECPLPIWGDPIKLPWVITNLVGNALRYTPAGGRITVELECREKVARTTISDTGPGVSPELLGRIFEPYAQFPDEPARAGSAGLGLHIAKEIVDAHNGRIFVDSARGRGSSFIVDIPLREQALG